MAMSALMKLAYQKTWAHQWSHLRAGVPETPPWGTSPRQVLSPCPPNPSESMPDPPPEAAQQRILNLNTRNMNHKYQTFLQMAVIAVLRIWGKPDAHIYELDASQQTRQSPSAAHVYQCWLWESNGSSFEIHITQPSACPNAMIASSHQTEDYNDT